MPINIDGWLARAETFEGQSRVGSLSAPGKSAEALGFAISMATTFYGATSQQVAMIKRGADNISTAKTQHNFIDLYQFATGCIKNMAAEIKGSLVGSIRLGVVGEVIADLMGLAREALAEDSVPVAAVLTAAAFEDLMRRLGQEKAGVTERIKLEQVLVQLKEKDVLQGGKPGVAQGFLKFRNDSLHADWDKVTEAQVNSCLGLLDTLIVKHLS